MIERLPAEVVMADTAYDADHLRQAIAAKGALAVNRGESFAKDGRSRKERKSSSVPIMGVEPGILHQRSRQSQ